MTVASGDSWIYKLINSLLRVVFLVVIKVVAFPGRWKGFPESRERVVQSHWKGFPTTRERQCLGDGENVQPARRKKEAEKGDKLGRTLYLCTRKSDSY
jgi:hypothetical protein